MTEPFWIRHGQRFTYLDIKDNQLAMQFRTMPTGKLTKMIDSKDKHSELIQRVLEERDEQHN